MFIRNIKDISPPVETYSCGSPLLEQFLETKNIFPIYQYTHHASEKRIWIYILCDDLSEALKEWSENNPNKDTKGGEIIDE